MRLASIRTHGGIGSAQLILSAPEEPSAPSLLGSLLTMDHFHGSHLTKKHQHRCLRTLCMALRVFQRIPYPRQNRLLWVLTAVGSQGRGWELALCIELVPGCLVPSLTPHLSLALILGQVSQRVGWMPPLVPRLTNIELLSEKGSLSKFVSILVITWRGKSEFGARMSSKPF